MNDGIKSFSVRNGDLYFNGFNLSDFDGMPAELLNIDISGLDHNDAINEIQKLNITFPAGPNGKVLDEEMVYNLHKLKNDALSFDVGPGVDIPVTMNGIDMVLFTGTNEKGETVVRNAFNVLTDLYNGTTGEGIGASLSASELTNMIKPLQDAQNHLLTKTAVIGGRTRRLELLESRYEQDAINYQRMKSDAEDVDMAEVIMNLRIAESVLQSAMSAGARAIQPTLMDFLR
jgi:flagellar hook-associated protein 3 FlgL